MRFIYTERDSKVGFLLRRLCEQISSFTRALCTHNGRSLQEKICRSLLAKFPTFESRSVYLLICFCSLVSMAFTQTHPESQIVIIDNFITPGVSQALIEFYDQQKCAVLYQHTDNELCFSPSTPPYIVHIVRQIAHSIRNVLKNHYGLFHKHYGLDHCALYSRIIGNYCGYHADNCRFICPLHGTDQALLRRTCPGTCPGSYYAPNHTPWREYTALLYLNDAFEGGEITFEDGPCNRVYKKTIPIKAGRLVLTPNGKDFYHEVFPIRSGMRYSLHFWFTSDPNHMGCIIQ